ELHHHVLRDAGPDQGAGAAPAEVVQDHVRASDRRRRRRLPRLQEPPAPPPAAGEHVRGGRRSELVAPVDEREQASRHITPNGLSVAEETLRRFVARVTRLYEQERSRPDGSAPLGLYVRRWTQWMGAGVPTVPALRA